MDFPVVQWLTLPSRQQANFRQGAKILTATDGQKTKT